MPSPPWPTTTSVTRTWYTSRFDLARRGDTVHLLMGFVLMTIGAFWFLPASHIDRMKTDRGRCLVGDHSPSCMWLPYPPFSAISLIGLNITVVSRTSPWSRSRPTSSAARWPRARPPARPQRFQPQTHRIAGQHAHRVQQGTAPDRVRAIEDKIIEARIDIRPGPPRPLRPASWRSSSAEASPASNRRASSGQPPSRPGRRARCFSSALSNNGTQKRVLSNTSSRIKASGRLNSMIPVEVHALQPVRQQRDPRRTADRRACRC